MIIRRVRHGDPQGADCHCPPTAAVTSGQSDDAIEQIPGPRLSSEVSQFVSEDEEWGEQGEIGDAGQAYVPGVEIGDEQQKKS